MNSFTTPVRKSTAEEPRLWSAAQLSRLQSEWERLRRGFAFHPTVRIAPVAGNPPSEYEVEYRLRTLIVDGTGQLAYVDNVTVALVLPPQFPQAAPILRPGAAIFHPNVSGDHIHLSPPWHAATGSLVDVVVRCGQMLAFQFHDPVVIYNVAAMQWAQQYANLLPTDPGAELGVDAEGGAPQRIATAGAATLERCRSQLAEMSLSIVEAAPGTSPEEVRHFGGEISTVLSVFADPDLPNDVKKRATELEAWAQSMTPERSLWDDLRTVRVSARAALAAAEGATPAQDALESAIRAVEAIGQNIKNVEQSAEDPLGAIAALPGVAALDAALIRLRGSIRGAEPHVSALRGTLEEISGAPLTPAGAPGSALFEQTTADTTRVNAAAAAARQAASASLAGIEPALARARAEQSALDALIAWAGFADLMRRGSDLAQRLTDLGVAGIQAYYVQGPAGSGAGAYGPYQLEERLDLSGALVVIRRIGAGPLEVYDARTMAQLARAPARVRVAVTGDDGKNAVEVDVRATEHIDELRVQLEYLLRTSREQMGRLGSSPGADTPSWAGRLSRAMAQFASTHAAAEMHRRASHRWAALLADLDVVARFKERVATINLVERHADFVPAVIAVADKAKASLSEATERLAFIAARSSRDSERGPERLVVPPQFGQEYVDRLKQRTKAEKDLAKVRKLLGLVTAELETRLANPDLHGEAGVPGLRILAMPSDTPADFNEMISDERLRSRVDDLDRLLGTRLSRHLR